MKVCIWILAGQSNCAGRGKKSELSNLLSFESASQHPACESFNIKNVYMFTGNGEWLLAEEPMHKDVDINRKDRCGVGPGFSLAYDIMKENMEESEKHFSSIGEKKFDAIGFVPCAIGGSSLDEWLPTWDTEEGVTYTPVIPNCVNKETYLNNYCDNAPNLFHATLYRLKRAVSSLQRILDVNEAVGYSSDDNKTDMDIQRRNELSSIEIKLNDNKSRCTEITVAEVNILWYQGESDALQSELSHSYASKFVKFAEEFRLHIKEDPIFRSIAEDRVKIFGVGVTSTSPSTMYLSTLRKQQMDILPKVLPFYYFVDAFGLPLQKDGLHLQTIGQVQLGKLIANRYFESRNSNSSESTCLSTDIYEPFCFSILVQEKFENDNQGGKPSIEDYPTIAEDLHERHKVIQDRTKFEMNRSITEGSKLQSMGPITLNQSKESTNKSFSFLYDADPLLESAKKLVNSVNNFLTDVDSMNESTSSGESDDRASKISFCDSNHNGKGFQVKNANGIFEGEEAIRRRKSIEEEIASNFVYGEINVRSFILLLYQVRGVMNLYFQQNDRLNVSSNTGPGSHRRRNKKFSSFIDLGSGEGKALLAALLTGLFTNIEGIEMIESLRSRSNELLGRLQSYISEKADDILNAFSSLDSPNYPDKKGKWKPSHQEILRRIKSCTCNVHCSDLFSLEGIESLQDPDMVNCNVLFLCGTCFSENQLIRLFNTMTSHLRENSIFILVDKTIPISFDKQWSLLFRCQVHVSWGIAAASIYIRN